MSCAGRWLLQIGASVLLVACSTPTPVPVAVRNADAVAQAARRAADQQHWAAAEIHWRDAAAQYAALDDWQHAGMASLGEAQAAQFQANLAGAEAIVRALSEGGRYPDTVKAEAYYSWALLALAQRDATTATQRLALAAQHAGANTPIQAAIWNARAKLAIAQQDWPTALDNAKQALGMPSADPREVANAYRLTGEALLRTGRVPEARAALATALSSDKALARPESILSDLRLLAEAARLGNQADAAVWQERADAACRALAKQDCRHDSLPAAPNQ